MVKSRKRQSQVLIEEKNNTIINGIIAQIASAFFIAIAALFPAFAGFDGYFGINLNKTIFLWVSVGVCVVGLLFMFVCVKGRYDMENYYTKDEPPKKITIAEWAVLAFISWVVISAFLSMIKNPEWANSKFGSVSVWFGADGRYEGLISFLCYTAIFIVISRFYKPKRLHLILIAGSALFVSLYGILQFFGVDILKLFPFGDKMFIDVIGNPLYGPLSAHFRTTIGNVNLISSYCSFAILLFAALFTVSRSKWQYLYLGASAFCFALSLTTGFSGDAHKVAILGTMVLFIPYWISNRERLGKILIVLSGWCIVYTGRELYISAVKRQLESGKYFPLHDQGFLNSYVSKNIMVFLALAAATFVIGFVLLKVIKKWPDRQMKIAGMIFLPVMLVGGLIGLEIIGSRYVDRPYHAIWQAREMMHGKLDDDFGSNRGWIWRNAVEVIPDNPVFGTGPDTFAQALGEERQTEAIELHGLIHDRAHNVFLQIAVCMGLPALVAYLIFLGSVFIPAIKPAFERPILFSFGAAAVSYFIQSFFSIEGPITTPLFWIALGVIAGEIWMAKIGCKSIEV